MSDPDQLTWAALLAQWVDFAKQAVGLPNDALGQRMRASVPDVIMLQAVWFALAHMDELTQDQRALGLDRAQVLIDRHVAALKQRWAGESMPDELQRLIDDAYEQLQRQASP